MQKSKGFTIIELLVVVAIIAVLTGIVLSSVTVYVNRGKDSSIQANLSSVLTNGATYYDAGTGPLYNGFCTSAFFNVPAAAIASINPGAGNAICNPSVAANPDGANADFCACSPLKSLNTTVFCVDFKGTKKTVLATTCAAECPAAGATSGTCL